MIKDLNLWKNFEKLFLKKEQLSYKNSLKIFEALWREAVSLKVLPPKNPLEGIETDLRIARILNSHV